MYCVNCGISLEPDFAAGRDDDIQMCGQCYNSAGSTIIRWFKAQGIDLLKQDKHNWRTTDHLVEVVFTPGFHEARITITGESLGFHPVNGWVMSDEPFRIKTRLEFLPPHVVRTAIEHSCGCKVILWVDMDVCTVEDIVASSKSPCPDCISMDEIRTMEECRVH